MRRPPPVRVDDGDVRRDVDSDDVRRVYPRLPATPAECNAMLRALDLDAYRATPSAFPPPGENTSTELSLGRIFNPLLQA